MAGVSTPSGGSGGGGSGPSLGPGSFHRHLVSRKGGKGRSFSKALAPTLLLTPMVDMFSMLVIFLLQAFSSSPELMVVTKGLMLPAAGSGTEIIDAPLLSISQEGVFLDQVKVGGTDQVLANPTQLLSRLEKLTKNWAKTHADHEFKGEINVQADKNLPSTTVAKLMGYLPSQHYGSIQLTVVAGGAGTPIAERTPVAE